MSIIVDQNTRLCIQGITGNEGLFHGEQMIRYGTNVVGGVTPGKGGQTALERPVFDSVAECVAAAGANASIIYVLRRRSRRRLRGHRRRHQSRRLNH